MTEQEWLESSDSGRVCKILHLPDSYLPSLPSVPCSPSASCLPCWVVRGNRRGWRQAAWLSASSPSLSAHPICDGQSVCQFTPPILVYQPLQERYRLVDARRGTPLISPPAEGAGHVHIGACQIACQFIAPLLLYQ